VRAAQRSKILDGHRSGGYARQRALSTSRNSLPRGAPFYNAWAGIVAPAVQEQRPGWEDGRTKKGACRVADSLSECAEAMRPSPSSWVWVALSQRLSSLASR
jgi:hypothetical protein